MPLSSELAGIQRTFWEETVYLPTGKPAACFFAVIGADGECAGHRQACHVIKRQRVRNHLRGIGLDEWCIRLAEWDPRNAVCGCSDRHHPRFDGQQMPPLVVWRHQLPVAVLEFALDYGLETALEDRCPAIGKEQ